MPEKRDLEFQKIDDLILPEFRLCKVCKQVSNLLDEKNVCIVCRMEFEK